MDDTDERKCTLRYVYHITWDHIRTLGLVHQLHLRNLDRAFVPEEISTAVFGKRAALSPTHLQRDFTHDVGSVLRLLQVSRTSALMPQGRYVTHLTVPMLSFPLVRA